MCCCIPKNFSIEISCFAWSVNYRMSSLLEHLGKDILSLTSNILLVDVADNVCTTIVPRRIVRHGTAVNCALFSVAVSDV